MTRPASGQVVEKRRQRGRVYALRFRAYGRRHYLTLGSSGEGWDRSRAEAELANVLADVCRGIWRAPEPELAAEEPRPEPTFHEFAAAWVERRRHEVDERTVEHWKWALSCHLLPFLAARRLSEITAELVDDFKVAKLREREERARQAAALQRLREQVPQGACPGARRRARVRLPRRQPGTREAAPLEGGEAAADLARAGRSPGPARRRQASGGRCSRR